MYHSVNQNMESGLAMYPNWENRTMWTSDNLDIMRGMKAKRLPGRPLTSPGRATGEASRRQARAAGSHRRWGA